MGALDSLERTLADRWRAAALAIACAGMLAAVLVVMAPWLHDLSTFGFHDWDVQTAHRYLVRLSLLRYRELPGWNPYACGGFPAWAYIEGGTTLVSPWLLPYLVLPMSIALRVEVLGCALIGAAGAYALASRFTTSHAARALVAALWAVNGRWGLQTASGHTWHLAYAWLPWCAFFFERLRVQRGLPRALDLGGGAACFAMLVYSGGIYPLPHTVLTLALYATCLAVAGRSARPLLALGAMGLLGAAMSAPKLLPMLDSFSKAPRLIESKETLDLGALVTMLTSPDQAFYSRPARVQPYGWHEWGIYVSAAGVLIMVVAALTVQGRRAAALKVTGAVLGVLGFGAFHPAAPWSLLHRWVPIFKSQHVPARFLYPAVLVLALVAAIGVGRAVSRRSARWPWLDALAACAVSALAIDVAWVAQKPMANAMWMVAPKIVASNAFHFEKEPPFQYLKRDWAGPMYLAMLGNTGVLNCYGTPPFERKGALASSDPAYGGEAQVEGGGAARLIAWTPNSATIEVEAAAEGAVLIYNMNFDEGWGAQVDAGVAAPDGGVVFDRDHRIAVHLPPGASRVRLRYRPPRLWLGMSLGAAAIALVWLLRRHQRRVGDVVSQSDPSREDLP